MRAPLKVRVLIVGTIAGGAGALALAAVKTLSTTSVPLALLAAAVVLTELFHVMDADGSQDRGAAHGFSFSSGVHLGTILILGPWAGALVAALGVVVVDPLRGAPRLKVAFNASAFALAALAGGGAFVLAGGRPGQLDVVRDLPAIAALAFAYWVVNTLLVSCVVSLNASGPLLSNLREFFRPDLSTTAEVGLGVALAAFALSQPWAIAALVPLLIAVYQAHERLALMRRGTNRALETFANVVDERDPSTFAHSSRVAEYVRDLAQSLGLPSSEVARLRWAGRLHDLGKIAVDAGVLAKPGELTQAEWSTMRRHPRLSARLLRSFRFAADEARAVEYHHERYDGGGYYGLGVDDIPLAAHFLTVADSFDAMTTDRPYRRGLSREEALGVIEQNLGTQFHPAVARAFVARQRGEDPTTAVSRNALTQLWRTPRLPRRRRSVQRVGEALPRALVLGGVVGAFVGIGFQQVELGALGAAVAASGLAWHVSGVIRARRLGAQLRAACSGAGRGLAFEQIVSSLAERARVRWAGLVAWQEQELDGRIELERGVVQGPTESALISWLLREVETAEVEPVVALGHELGRDGVHLALPLRPDGALTGFLVLHFGRALPRHVRLALADCAGPLADALAPERERRAVRRPALAAVS